jgi:hypothetical protein
MINSNRHCGMQISSPQSNILLAEQFGTENERNIKMDKFDEKVQKNARIKIRIKMHVYNSNSWNTESGIECPPIGPRLERTSADRQATIIGSRNYD